MRLYVVFISVNTFALSCTGVILILSYTGYATIGNLNIIYMLG